MNQSKALKAPNRGGIPSSSEVVDMETRDYQSSQVSVRRDPRFTQILAFSALDHCIDLSLSLEAHAAFEGPGGPEC